LKANGDIKLLESATYQSFTQVLISPTLRLQFNITDYVYLYVTSILDSTYTLSAAANNHGYNDLYAGMPEISVVEG